MKEFFFGSLKWIVQLVISIFLLGWVSYGKVESYVDEKVKVQVTIVDNLRQKDINNLSAQIKKVDEKQDIILMTLLNTRRR